LINNAKFYAYVYVLTQILDGIAKSNVVISSLKDEYYLTWWCKNHQVK